MQLQKVIEQAGYSPHEAKAYLSLLGSGESLVTDLAKKLKMPRTTAQLALDGLRKKGAADYYTQRRYKYWSAVSPEKLFEQFSAKYEAFRSSLPVLGALRRERRKKIGSTDAKNIEAFRSVAESSSQAVLITNDVPEILYVNTAWERQFGYVLQEVEGRNPRMLRSGKTPVRVHAEMWKALRAGAMFQSDEIVDRRKDGSLFALLSTVMPLSRGGKTYYIQILDDITAKKRIAALGERLIDSKKS